MPVSWRVSQEVVFLEGNGQATLDEWMSAVDGSLASGDYRPGMGVVQDWRRTKAIPGAKVIRLRIDVLVERARAGGVKRWAIVVAGEARWELVITGDTYGGGTTDERLNGRSSVEFRVFNGLLLYFTQLVSYRCAIHELRIGIDNPAPARLIALPPCDPRNPVGIPGGFDVTLKVPVNTRSAFVKIVYTDGSVSEVRQFRR